MVRFFITYNYDEALKRIEDHIFETSKSADAVFRFLDEHDKALEFIENNPNAPSVSTVTGEQTWIFGDGRYRLFFKAIVRNQVLHVYLTHLIDNREANLEIYPSNKIPTYDEDYLANVGFARGLT